MHTHCLNYLSFPTLPSDQCEQVYKGSFSSYTTGFIQSSGDSFFHIRATNRAIWWFMIDEIELRRYGLDEERRDIGERQLATEVY